MKKLPISLVAASVSVISAQAAADQTIKVDQSKVVNDNVDDMKKAFNDSDSAAIVNQNIYEIARKITYDDKPLVQSDNEAQELIAYRSRMDDSFDSYGNRNTRDKALGSSRCYNNCHSACHSACHGSRGWR